MNHLQKLVAEYDWILQCWEDGYKGGTWAAITPHLEHAYTMRNVTDGSDIGSFCLGEYLSGKGAWLPVVRGSNLQEIIEKLNEKVSYNADNDNWRKDVYEAFQRVMELSENSYRLVVAVEYNDADLFKPEYL